MDAEKRTILIENFSFSFRQVDWIYEGGRRRQLWLELFKVPDIRSESYKVLKEPH